MNSALLPLGLSHLGQLPRSNSPCHSALRCVEQCLLRRSLLRRLYSRPLLPCRGFQQHLLPLRRLRCCPSAGDHRRSQLVYLDQPLSLATSLAAAFHARLSELRDQTASPEPNLHLPWLARLRALRAPPAWCYSESQFCRRPLPPRSSGQRPRHPASPSWNPVDDSIAHLAQSLPPAKLIVHYDFALRSGPRLGQKLPMRSSEALPQRLNAFFVP